MTMSISIFNESLLYQLIVCLLKVIIHCSVLEYYLRTVYSSLRRIYQLHIRTCARILCLRLWLFMIPTTANRAIQSFKLVNLDVLRVCSLHVSASFTASLTTMFAIHTELRGPSLSYLAAAVCSHLRPQNNRQFKAVVVAVIRYKYARILSMLVSKFVQH